MIFKKKLLSFIFIQYYFLINFQENIPPTFLFGTTFFIDFQEKNPSYIFIQLYFFINFLENFPPTLLCGTTFLLIWIISKKSSVLHSYSGLLLYSEL